MIRRKPNHHPINNKGMVLWADYRNSGSVSALETFGDYSGHSNHIELLNNAVVTNQGIVLDGASYGRVSADDFKFTGDFTVSFRLKYASSGSWSRIIDCSNYDSGNDGWMFNYRANWGDIEFRITDVLPWESLYIPSSNFTVGKEYVITGTFNNTSKTGKIYLDGVLKDSGTGSGVLSYSGINYLGIGARLNTSAKEYMTGSTNCIQAYTRELKNGEILTNVKRLK